MHNISQAKRANLLLATGALIGIILAASGILQDSTGQLDKHTLANVNGKTISKAEYLGYIDRLEQEKRSPMTTADRRHVLDRMIDEKLLLDRGQQLGLPDSSAPVRKLIVQQVMQSAVSNVSAEQPSDKQLKQFYQDNIGYFTFPPRAHVRRLVFRNHAESSAEQRATQAYQLLRAGGALSDAIAMADTDLLGLPGELLPRQKLLQYLGPSQTDKAFTLENGEISAPIADNGQYVLLIMLQRQDSQARPFDDIRELVISEYERRQGDQALADYLEDLREQANIHIDERFIDELEALAVDSQPPKS
ncbi:MAG: peptidyl-prolyl cis-trans isomerase [Pseudomonadales bacterium]